MSPPAASPLLAASVLRPCAGGKFQVILPPPWVAWQHNCLPGTAKLALYGLLRRHSHRLWFRRRSSRDDFVSQQLASNAPLSSVRRQSRLTQQRSTDSWSWVWEWRRDESRRPTAGELAVRPSAAGRINYWRRLGLIWPVPTAAAWQCDVVMAYIVRWVGSGGWGCFTGRGPFAPASLPRGMKAGATKRGPPYYSLESLKRVRGWACIAHPIYWLPCSGSVPATPGPVDPVATINWPWVDQRKWHWSVKYKSMVYGILTISRPIQRKDTLVRWERLFSWRR